MNKILLTLNLFFPAGRQALIHYTPSPPVCKAREKLLAKLTAGMIFLCKKCAPGFPNYVSLLKIRQF